jgi:hypothetical protein
MLAGKRVRAGASRRGLGSWQDSPRSVGGASEWLGRCGADSDASSPGCVAFPWPQSMASREIFSCRQPPTVAGEDQEHANTRAIWAEPWPLTPGLVCQASQDPLRLIDRRTMALTTAEEKIAVRGNSDTAIDRLPALREHRLATAANGELREQHALGHVELDGER